MTRFTASLAALALLVAVPARAEPIWIAPWSAHDGTCMALECYAVQHLRSAYERGEITSVRLNTQKECNKLNFNVDFTVPCTPIYPGR